MSGGAEVFSSPSKGSGIAVPSTAGQLSVGGRLGTGNSLTSNTNSKSSTRPLTTINRGTFKLLTSAANGSRRTTRLAPKSAHHRSSARTLDATMPSGFGLKKSETALALTDATESELHQVNRKLMD